MENPGEPWPRPALFTETLSCPCKSGCPRHRSPSAGKALAPSQARESTGNRAAATEMGSQRGRALPSFQRPGPTCSVLPSLPPAETSRDTAETLHRGEKKARCSLFFFFPLPRSLQCNSQGAGVDGGTPSLENTCGGTGTRGSKCPLLPWPAFLRLRAVSTTTQHRPGSGHPTARFSTPSQHRGPGPGPGRPPPASLRFPPAPLLRFPPSRAGLTAHARAARACAEPTGALRGR